VVVLQLSRVLSRRPCVSPVALAQRVPGQVLCELVLVLHEAAPARLP
jgi:hypothetical protein